MPRKYILTISLLFMSALVFVGAGCVSTQPRPPVNIKQNMKVSSPAFNDMEKIPVRYTCDGDNVNPPLDIYEVPTGTKSLALIVDDPDATGKIWSHWVMWNISSNINTLPENGFPAEAVQGINDFGSNRYGGPCPPGTTPHRYEFKVYALDIMIDLPASAQKADLEKAMNEHVKDFAEITGLYNRGD